jgi:regulator of protease activity HflC (stomatin/prohibitin superfamily)
VVSGSDESAVPVSLVMAAVPVQYRVKDLYSFIYNHNEPEKRLEAICYRELTKFASSAKIEVDDEADLEQSLLGAGRSEAKNILTREIQKAADEAELGVEIVFLGLQGIHPPPEVASDYQAVVGAVQEKQSLILEAQAERNKSLSSLVGSVQAADALYGLAAKYEQAEDTENPENVEKLGNELDAALEQAKGDIYKTIKESQSYAFEKMTLAKAFGERFTDQLKAYKSAEEIYKSQLRLAVLEEAMKNIRKYVVVADQNDIQVFILDVQEKLTPSLYDVGGFEETSQ